MNNQITKIIIMGISLGLVAQLTACGTILHPERKGQRSGSIDPKIAIFDAIGLLFFLIPGVIAFAVDFSNGTIYLPGGRRASLSPQELERVTINGKVNEAELAKLIQEKGVVSAVINVEQLNTKALASVEEVQVHLAAFGVQYASN